METTPRTKRPRVWPWVVSLLALAVLVWAVLEMVGADRPESERSMVVGQASRSSEGGGADGDV